MSDERRNIKVPVLEHVELESFSLYKLQPLVSVRVDSGVFCLAGANGLGKSSFIAALGFGFTGTVAPEKSNPAELNKFYRDAMKYGDRYFAGRVRELDRGNASVSLKFWVGTRRYSLTRGFFEPQSLRFLEIHNSAGDPVLKHDQNLDDEDRHDLYADMLTEDCGLQTFAQFVFLHHYLLTFDERRHLLFWDTRASEQVLYLALGLDPSLAKRAADLRKAASAAGSQARNAQYAATTARQQLRRLNDAIKGEQSTVDEHLLVKYRGLLQERRDANTTRDRLSKELDDARLELATASAQQLRLRHDYEDAFRSRYRSHSTPHLHALVAQTLADHQCRVCRTQHKSGPERVEQAMRDNRCPLCEADISRAAAPDDSARLLTNIDEALTAATASVTAGQKRVERLSLALEQSHEQAASLLREISDIESEHNLDSTKAEGPDVDELTAQATSLRSAIDVAITRKNKQLELRAEAQAEYDPIRSRLIDAWQGAELEFVPLFRELAEGFIGLPLSIQLDEGAGSFGNAHLALSVDSSHRREATQLSESQRFFLDIALRMALIQYMTPPDLPSVIYVDTPEGALDIAYEARAGELFSRFALLQNQLIMTANVNTSQLLRRLAKRCGADNMRLVRMTEWTTLSDVQIEEEELFEEAYDLIEENLRNPVPVGTHH